LTGDYEMKSYQPKGADYEAIQRLVKNNKSLSQQVELLVSINTQDHTVRNQH